MSLKVIQAGHFTTVQDMGRPGYRDRGIPLGGACDRTSARLANALLGNELDLGVLELTAFGGVYEAEVDLGLSVTGAPFRVEITRADGGAGVRRQVPSSFALNRGDRLSIGGTAFGARAYLGVVGGWRSPGVLGSLSSERRIEAGDVMKATPCRIASQSVDDFRLQTDRTIELRIVFGPEGGPAFALECCTYRVGPASDRMGVRLEGKRLEDKFDRSRLSAPVSPGAVQLAGGLPIILGVAGGTIGGYPHVATVASCDLDRLGQLVQGVLVRFKRIEVDEARAHDREMRRRVDRRLLQIQAACRDTRASS